MTTIQIPVDDTLAQSLRELARADSKSVEALSREVLSQYVQKATAKYSFIGIGRSGKGNLSTAVEETLAEGADKREGWSLRE